MNLNRSLTLFLIKIKRILSEIKYFNLLIPNNRQLIYLNKIDYILLPPKCKTIINDYLTKKPMLDWRMKTNSMKL